MSGVDCAETAAGLDAESVRDVIESRALIEQAKGMLIFVYGIDADAAFELLRSQSQDHNVKLRFLAEQIVKDLQELSASSQSRRRLGNDSLLLAAHQRIARVAERQRNGQSKTGK